MVGEGVAEQLHELEWMNRDSDIVEQKDSFIWLQGVSSTCTTGYVYRR